ncbi:saccharopine dehydrogenase NADP-binding domain-containing protein [Thermococcus argininiproducens]|uniref:Saccharopine dehydrogenase NADP-binding domain-containing protein n=1 Tax=Thermococcus argininiproducens TaxID=2866384 RepID=A0A9E7MBN7_9EURY|nr:saccharopine dehydrogenase C-terminal domain-containing protein [Thermococcus argininiproducens]USH00666.1 saccharopine dehydrogenase NADP-binding domain-containing protein [Thermococcus argininiproducens]
MRVLVLGAGNVGKAIAWDLKDEFDVSVGDVSERRLKELSKFVKTIKIDASDFNELVRIMRQSELVIGALPGRFGYSTVKAAIKAGVDIVDVSFMPENPLELQKEAEKNQVTVVFDAGFAPGLSHIFLGRIYQKMDELKEAYIYVGGLPKEPKPPLYYRITWSPYDLIEEYTRPARIVKDGEILSVDPLGDIKIIEINGKKFEGFISDGLRSLLENINAKRLEEWTLRWPGHLAKMKILRELRFFNPENLENTLNVISPLMTYESPDFSIMEVIGKGRISGKPMELRYFLYDEEKDGFTSMARVTGFTTAIIARIVGRGACAYGVIPPEILGMREDTYLEIMNGLKNRGIQIEVSKNASSDNS